MKLYNETDIANIADAIREKNGSTDTYKVSEMAGAIENIPTGFDIVPYITSLSRLFSDSTFPNTDLELNFNSFTGTSLGYLFSNADGIKTLNLSFPSTVTLLNAMFLTATIDVINITSSTKNVTNWSSTFEGCKATEINNLDLSSATNVSRIFSSTANYLEKVGFVENSVPISIAISNSGQGLKSDCPDESLVLLANGLKEGVTATLTAIYIKSRFNSLMGTIEEVTEDDVTYHKFIADESGTVTLTDFITNTKGWTIA